MATKQLIAWNIPGCGSGWAGRFFASLSDNGLLCTAQTGRLGSGHRKWTIQRCYVSE
jgi:hypothetical protein